MLRRRSVVAISRRESEPTSFGAEKIRAKTVESRSVPRSPVRSEWKNPRLSHDLSAFSRLYAKSTDCVAEKGGFEPPSLFQDSMGGIRPEFVALFGPNKARLPKRPCSPGISLSSDLSGSLG